MSTDRDRAFWNPEAQTLSADELDRLAREGIAREWQRVWDLPIPFYRDKFEAAGLSRDQVPDLDDIPLTTKNDLRANEAAQPPFGTHRALTLDEAVRIGGSTGTSGTPVFIMFGEGDLEPAIELQCRTLWRFGVRPFERFTHSWPQGFYVSSTFSALWFTRVPILEIPVGPPLNLDLATEHLRLWQTLKPHGFQMTSSQLRTYEDAAAANGIDMRELTEGRKIGILDAIYQFEGPRKRIESIHGFDMRNMAGAGEVPGFGVTDCGEHAGFHVPSDYVKIQVVDPETGRSLPEGERGHLVLNIFGFQTFMLRYDLEDICTMTTEPCACGETGARFTMYGRHLDAVELDGKTILPIDVQVVLDDHDAPEFVFSSASDQDGASLRIQVETEGGGAALESALTESLGVPVRVDEVAVGSLPRSFFKPRRVSTK